MIRYIALVMLINTGCYGSTYSEGLCIETATDTLCFSDSELESIAYAGFCVRNVAPQNPYEVAQDLCIKIGAHDAGVDAFEDVAEIESKLDAYYDAVIAGDLNDETLPQAIREACGRVTEDPVLCEFQDLLP